MRNRDVRAATARPRLRRLEGSANGAVRWHRLDAYFWLKRSLDFALSLSALVLFCPLFLVIALLIQLDSPGPAIFAQKRMGYDWRRRRQRPFVLYKFRSMYHNSDQGVHQRRIRAWIRGGTGDACHAPVVALVRDVRVTRVGRFLRKTSLDELPQLWNVLKGEMSLVGPRPVPLYEVAEYDAWQRRRLETIPGLTGLWQVAGRKLTTPDEMARLDIQYIENRSLWLDLWILFRTVPSVVSGRGAG